MKLFLIKLSIFTIIIVVSDLVLGGIFKLYDYTQGGEIHKIHSIMKEENPELLILGSSRASRHYVSAVIADSLNMNVYNAGLDGQGTTMSYGFLKGIGQRSYPRYILCEITPNFDLYESTISLYNFYPYVKFGDIHTLILSFDRTQRYKLLSNAYRLNSAIFRLIPSILSTRRPFIDGYEPSFGSINKNIDIDLPETIKKEPTTTKKNILKEKYLNDLINIARTHDCKMVFFISPIYQGADSTYYKEEMDIIKKYNIPIFNHLNDERFIYNPKYFSDKNHFNHEGATKYTKIIINDLKSIQMFGDTIR